MVSCKSDSEDIRIYINDILHLRLPRDKHIKIQSWIEGHTKTYVIEIWCAGHLDRCIYDNKKLWKQVLSALDNEI